MSIQLGSSWYLYRNTGTHASPTWGLINQVSDVNLALSMNSGEIRLRSLAYALELPGKLTGSVDINLVQNIDDTTWDNLMVDFLAGDQKQFAVCNGTIATSGVEGFKFFGLIKEMPLDQPLEELVEGTMSVAFGYTEEPAGTVIPPQWFTIA